ncbi:MAG: STAS domain-containing protein [Actinobacteria bacterium]|nr:STAS domain-containing protein [Actinomycetota bacterium]MBW3648981.1 STAS domain-containing protein [Actinomycetota bacterium]
MNLDRQEIEQRKAWLGLDEEDSALLRQIDDLVGPDVEVIVDDLTRALLPDGKGAAPPLDHSRKLLRDYFGELTNADGLGEAFVERRLAMVDALHENVSSDVSWYLAAYLFYLQEVAKRIRELRGGAGEMQQLQRALAKVMFLDLGLAIDAYVFERDRTIRVQQQELEHLSTPVLQLRQGLLILPVVGILDARRAQQLTEQLLEAIRTRRGRVVVLDITGVAVVDSRVANHLIQTVDAARLMGARAIVTGVSPEIAQTLVGLGIDLANVTTVSDLQGGVDEADRLLGLRVVRVDDARPTAP